MARGALKRGNYVSHSMPIEPFLGFLQTQLKLNNVSEDDKIYSYKNIEEIVLALMGSDFIKYYRSTNLPAMDVLNKDDKQEGTN